ncbi:MAG: cytochrome P450 [Alphaproteobacteria bacterium]|nr:MAG: cytochrome P450 [Alphaproteobacteria bacterium]
MANSTNIPAYPIPRSCPMHPPDNYDRMRRERPVTEIRLWDGSVAWLATGYDVVRQLLSDPRLGNVPATPGYPAIAESRAAMLRAETNNFAFMDDPEHGRFRAMLAKMFTVKQIEKLRPTVENIVRQLLDDMERKGPPADLMQSYSLALPSLVISALLGVPYEDHEFFQECARARVSLHGDPAVSANAGRLIWEYMDRLLAAREIEQGDDLLSRLYLEQVKPGHLARADAIGMARALLLAGHDTTATQISAGVLTLLLHPDQLAEIKADPGLWRDAVEEILRFFTITQHNAPRVALADIDIAGVTIKAGQGVIASLAAANRDPAVFEDPGRFDIHRQADHHVAFAYGVHQCLGHALARLELEIAFRRLFERFPGLALAVPFDELPFKVESLTYGVERLPVKWS